MEQSVFNVEYVAQKRAMPEAPVFQTVPSVLAVCPALCICTLTKQPQAELSGFSVDLSYLGERGNTHIRYSEIIYLNFEVLSCVSGQTFNHI